MLDDIPVAMSPLAKLKRWLKLKVKPTTTIAGVQLPVHASFSTMMQDILYVGVYEQPELALLAPQLRADDVVMEVGAGVGFLSAFCAKQIGSERVFAFEANPNMEPHIRKTYQLNKVKPNLQIGMLGAQAGKHTFYVAEHFWMSSTTQQDGMRPVQIPVYDVKTEMRRIKPTFLVMDIEGGEYELIKLIDFSTITKCLIEVHPDLLSQDQIDEIHNVLKLAGFSVISQAGANSEVLYLERQPAQVQPAQVQLATTH